MITLSENQKKGLFIVFFVLFTLGTGYALYYFFFRPQGPVAPQLAEQPGYAEFGAAGERGEIPPYEIIGEGVLPEAQPTFQEITDLGTSVTEPDETILRDEVTQALSLGPDGSARFYDPDTGRFYRIDENGNEIPLSTRQFYNVDEINWAAKSNEAILEFPDGNNIYYDFDDERQVTLPNHWQDFEFSPHDSQIVAKSVGLDEKNRFLITANADGNEATAVYSMGANGDLVIPSWSPNNQVIGFSKTGQALADGAQQIVLLGKNHENFKALDVPGRGFIPNWSPSGNKILYSVYHERDNLRPMLWVSDASGSDIGRNRKKLNIITWADKCAWADENTLYCGVPSDLPPGAAIDPAAFSQVSNDIYKINLSTGISQKLDIQTSRAPVSNPFISQDKTKFIFTDSSSGKLYSYDIN
ncbi:MAG: TolB family protein [Patescibacteria group bacterium]